MIDMLEWVVLQALINPPLYMLVMVAVFGSGLVVMAVGKFILELARIIKGTTQ